MTPEALSIIFGVLFAMVAGANAQLIAVLVKLAKGEARMIAIEKEVAELQEEISTDRLTRRLGLAKPAALLLVACSLLGLGGCTEAQLRAWEDRVQEAQIARQEAQEAVQAAQEAAEALESAEAAQVLSRAVSALERSDQVLRSASDGLEAAVRAREQGAGLLQTLIVGLGSALGVGGPAAVAANALGRRKGYRQGLYQPVPAQPPYQPPTQPPPA